MAAVLATARKEPLLRARQRIDVRLRPDQKAEIERAAHIKGLTLTDFIVQHAVENARKAIREYETWTLERPDAEFFAAALMKPAALGPRLARAAKHYKEHLARR